MSTEKQRPALSFIGFSQPTHICDPNGHHLVKEVEDQDDDKVDAGGGDRSGQLRRDEPAHQLDLLHRVCDETRKGSVHSQPVCDDADDAGHYQAQLSRSTQTFEAA